MSSTNITNELSAKDVGMLSALVREGKEQEARTLLSEYKNSDVNAFITDVSSKDWSIDTSGAAASVSGKSGSNVPAGVGDVQSMISGDTGFTLLSKPAAENSKPGEVPAPAEQVSEKELKEMWNEWDNFDTGILDQEMIEAFKYQGFNPDEILKSLMRKKMQNNVGQSQFLKDMSILVALAVIKGSVTDNNLKKMSDKGKAQYNELEKRYGITRGGGKGKSAQVVTIARIAAAFPGKVIQMLQNGQVPGRQFVGDLNTHKLPGVIQHQALAACIPKSMEEKSKTFLLNLITAYSVDQTRVISKVKVDMTTLLDRQKQFTDVSHGGMYPPETMRKKIIQSYNWNEIFSDIAPVAAHIKTKWPDFNTIDQTEFIRSIGSIS